MGVEFVGIELDLRGEEGVYSDLQKIDQLLNSLRGKSRGKIERPSRYVVYFDNDDYEDEEE